jgi:crotonobetainyl-CoA:carnitine CoA-transferase CaiB-like acyl-CoA transferase
MRPANTGPLSGVVVLDLGQYLAGPFATMVLADLGAYVIKVEPVRGDAMRAAGKPFLGCQRGKQDIAVDLKAPEGVEVVMRLAELADVVHHNMTKGTAERLGIGYAALRVRNPRLVHCNTYAYGPEGPLSGFGGLDPLYQAACGLEYEAGPVADGNPPLYLRFGMCDTANAMVSVVGVLAALFHQRRTGEGQDLWTSLLNGAAVFGSDVFIVDGEARGGRPALDRDQTGLSPCYRMYETQDGWLQVAAHRADDWRALCGVLGVGGTGDRYATFDARVAHRAEIEPVLEAAFRTRTAVAWQALFDEVGVPCEVSVNTNDGEAALHDADNERLGLVTEYEHPTLGRLRQFGTLIDFSEARTGPYTPPPLVGQDTCELLRRVGYDASEIDDLLARGVVYEPSGPYPWPI